MEPGRSHLIKGFVFSLLLSSLFLFTSNAKANLEYANQTGKDCLFCHRSADGGPELTRSGEAYRKGGYRFPIPDESLGEAPWYRQLLSIVIGYLHLAAGVVWFGTIFYVHIIIRPERLTQGLPRSELILGWVCIFVTGLSGAILTLMRINNVEQLVTTRFGIILSIKIILFSLMVAVAVVTTFFIRGKLMERKRQQKGDHDHPRNLSHTELLSFDGTGSSPAYIGVDKEVYDVSESPTWRGGRHMAQHFAGRDLSEALLSAPHGREVLLKFKKVGRVWERPIEAHLPVTPVRKTFLILAKSALVISFLILFCVALWRWG